MKTKIISSLLIFSVCLSGLSQDLVLTNTNDSINCNIAKLKDDFIFFTFINDQGRLLNTIMPLSEVYEYKYDYYVDDKIPNSKVFGDTNYPHFRIAISGGFSYLTAKVSDAIPIELVDYIMELKSGYHFSSDATYYVTKNFGFGLSYSLFKSSNLKALDGVNLNGNIIYGILIDNISVNYVGPTFSTRFLNDNNNAFIFAVSCGYAAYKNYGSGYSVKELTGSTVALALSVDYDIELAKNLMLGFQFSFTMGSINNMDITSSNYYLDNLIRANEYENINRIDISIGLRFVK